MKLSRKSPSGRSRGMSAMMPPKSSSGTKPGVMSILSVSSAASFEALLATVVLPAFTEKQNRT